MVCYVFFFNDTATTEIYTLSLHDALPISLPWKPRTSRDRKVYSVTVASEYGLLFGEEFGEKGEPRSEEHTSELQSRQYLVCRLLLAKDKQLTSFNEHHQVSALQIERRAIT